MCSSLDEAVRGCLRNDVILLTSGKHEASRGFGQISFGGAMICIDEGEEATVFCDELDGEGDDDVGSLELVGVELISTKSD